MSAIAMTGKVGLGKAEGNNGGTMPLMVKFQESVKKDDIEGAKALLFTYTGAETETWPENPLHFACEHGSHRMAMEIAEGWPKLAILPNQDGDTAMHLVSAKGDVEMVEFLEQLNSESCLVENNNSMIPLHIAVAKGHGLVIRKLVSLCPESLKKLTSKQETAFHVAVNKSQSGAFHVLVDETKKLELGHLLNNKDDEGNTVLHTAASKRLTDIVKLLILESSSSSSGVKIQVNSMNEGGLTALDICRANSPDIASQEISLILQKAADDEISSLESQQKNSRVPNMVLGRLSEATRNVLLVVLVMVAGTALTVTCNLSDDLLEKIYRSSFRLQATATDFIFFRLPSIVYLMIFNSAGFFTSMLVISYLVWPLPLSSFLLFVMVCTCVVYIILVDHITPKVSVRVGNFSFSSITLVWSSAVALIFFGVTIIQLGRYALLLSLVP